MQKSQGDFTAGARNMLLRCGGLRAGDRLLIVSEPVGTGYYCDRIAAALLVAARDIGLRATGQAVPFQPRPQPPDDTLKAAMQASDLTVFLARLGDQLRFRNLPPDSRALVSYALDVPALGSDFGCLDHTGMCALRDAVDAAIIGAREVVVTCPGGTELRGYVAAEGPRPEDTKTIRFPRLVNTPMPAVNFSGVIAMRGFLVGTGSQYYDPYTCRIDGTLWVAVEGNRITGFDGSADDVARAVAHYDQVASRFRIDARFVHSWHAGIHPGCRFDGPASGNFERWTGSAFGNPRLLHFHTCGAYAPGEISLNIADATVMADGVPVWDTGRLCPQNLPGGVAVLDRFPDIRAAFDAPVRECGLGPDGRLSFR